MLADSSYQNSPKLARLKDKHKLQYTINSQNISYNVETTVPNMYLYICLYTVLLGLFPHMVLYLYSTLVKKNNVIAVYLYALSEEKY